MGKHHKLSNAGKWCKKEFHPQNLSLVHPNSKLFVQSQWSDGYVSLPFLCYRIVVALILLVWPVVDIWVEESRWFRTTPYIWILFATNWSFIILSLSSVVSAVNVMRFYVKQRRILFHADISPPPGNTDCFLSFHWLLHVLSSNLAILVSVVFWGFVMAFEGPAFLKSGMSIAKHTANSAYVLIDMLIIATPVRLLHLVYPMVMGVIYVTFYAIYFAAGGAGLVGNDHIYEMIDWGKNPVSSVLTCLFAFAMIVLSQLVLYLVYKIRVNVGRKRRDDEDDEEGIVDPSTDEDDDDDATLESDISTGKLATNYHAIN